MTVNDPELVRTLARLHDAYEQAIVTKDVAALSAFFWDPSHVLRYGVDAQLYGSDESRSPRGNRPTLSTDRRIVCREIAILDSTFASIIAEVAMLVGGVRHSSHQSQTWVRVPTLGWRIVSTHLSVPTAVLHAEAPSATLGAVVARTLVPLPPNAHRPAVTNLEGTAHTTGSP